jgi:hypothetical protein
MGVNTMAKEIAEHPRWRWHGAMMCTDAEGKLIGVYSYVPADIEAFPDLDCSRVRGRMLADIFMLAQEVHFTLGELRVTMSRDYECMARGHEAVPSCWLSMSRWLVGQEAKNGAQEVASGGP